MGPLRSAAPVSLLPIESVDVAEVLPMITRTTTTCCFHVVDKFGWILVVASLVELLNQ